MSFKGDLESLNLSTVLQILSSEGKTGVLEILRGKRKSLIYLKGGKIVAASSGRKKLQLGHLLYSRGLVSREQLQEAVAEAARTGIKLGEAVLTLGYVSSDSLQEVVRDQVRETVLDLFILEKGEFEYRDYPVKFDENVFEEINAMEIMLEAARRMDEWAVIRKVITSDTMIFKMSAQAGQQDDRISLNTGEWRLASLLDGSKSVRDIVKQSGSGEFGVYKTLYAMATSRLIQPVEKPEAPEETREEDEFMMFIPICHDVLITISRHLEDQLGEGFCAKLFDGCKESLVKEYQPFMSPYQVHLSAEQNLKEIVAVSANLKKGSTPFPMVAGAFNQFISCLLMQETEILGARQTQHTIGRIHELLGVVERYRGGKKKSQLIEGIRGTVSQVASHLQG